jgi:transcriptional regulator with XRE-family HTH domain
MTKALRYSGVGVQEMADHLDVSRNAVSSWINGRNEPRRRDLRDFALRTGYPLSWFEKGKCTPWDLNPEPTGSGSDEDVVIPIEWAFELRERPHNREKVFA